MNRKLSILVLMICTMGLLAFYTGTAVTAASEPQNSSGDSVQELKTRVAKLEAQVAVLRAQIKELSSKAPSRVLAIPGTHDFPEGKMPPGAAEYKFNGMKYWSLPLKEGQ
jgi:hypothetical protein